MSCFRENDLPQPAYEHMKGRNRFSRASCVSMCFFRLYARTNTLQQVGHSYNFCAFGILRKPKSGNAVTDIDVEEFLGTEARALDTVPRLASAAVCLLTTGDTTAPMLFIHCGAAKFESAATYKGFTSWQSGCPDDDAPVWDDDENGNRHGSEDKCWVSECTSCLLYTSPSPRD